MPDALKPDDNDLGAECDLEPDGEFIASAASFLFASDDPARRPVNELYAAFRRPRNEDDREAGELARRSGALDLGVDEDGDLFPPEMPEFRRKELSLGEVIHAEGRLLLAGLGGGQDKLYAAPTTKDGVATLSSRAVAAGTPCPGRTGLSLSRKARGGPSSSTASSPISSLPSTWS